MPNTKLWYLKNFNFIEACDDEMRDFIHRQTSMKCYAKKQPIYFPGDPSDTIFLLKEGQVKISKLTEDGRQVILDVLGQGEIFGELSLLDDNQPRDEIAESVGEAIVCSIQRKHFEKALEKNPSAHLEVTKRIGLKLRKFEEKLSEMLFKDVRKRIAGFLVHHAEDYGTIKQGVITIKTNLSHEDIGSLTGAARQTVSTVMNELKSAGMIDFTRKTIIIYDLDKLREYAE